MFFVLLATDSRQVLHENSVTVLSPIFLPLEVDSGMINLALTFYFALEFSLQCR